MPDEEEPIGDDVGAAESGDTEAAGAGAPTVDWRAGYRGRRHRQRHGVIPSAGHGASSRSPDVRTAQDDPADDAS